MESKPLDPALAEIMTRFLMNLARAQTLIDTYEGKVGERMHGRKKVMDADLLRAAVVFIHASVEDFLRSLTILFLPAASPAELDNVPLIGLGKSGRPEKFLMGSLVPHRSKLVSTLIQESVEEYLKRATYNSAPEVVAALKSCGLRVDRVRRLLPILDNMIRRRHQIVHTADTERVKGRGKQFASSISAKQVRRWLNAAGQLIIELFGDVMDLHDRKAATLTR